MQDKLQKVLQIKIDAINKNIDNLNYLNGELDKNNENLIYIKDKISLFKNNELLNFDQISKDDFEKILLMIDPAITDIFRDKTCNYDGIIYIIEGIRKSISLQLTQNQTSAILSFVEGMKIKSINLQDVINNLIESKNRLPETDLDILMQNLNKYEDIVSKHENNLYLSEIDEIEDALDFADSPLEEKVDMFEYLLKYNADIYNLKIEQDGLEEENYDKNNFDNNDELNLPTFNFEMNDNNDENYSLDETTNENNVEENVENQDENELNEEEHTYEEQEKVELDSDINLEDNNDEDNFSDIKFNLDQVFNNQSDLEKTKEIANIPSIDEPLPKIESVTFPSVDILNTIENNDSDNLEVNPLPELPVEESEIKLDNENIENNNSNMPFEEIESTEENHELNTVELEDIIKKIDARLKEMEPEEKVEENDFQVHETFEPITETNVDYKELLATYALPEMHITNKNKEDVEGIITILNNNNVLDNLKNNKDVLENILSNCTKERLENIISLIKDNLLVKSDEFDYIFDIMLRTMPILFTREDVLESFKLNLEFFKEKKLNIINLFDNYRELLIMNNEVLKNNYKKVEQYGFEINNDNVKYYLYNKNIIENIDSYIEAVGYEKGFLGRDDHFDGVDYIKKNPYKLNEINKDTLMKLRYSSENNKKIYGNKPGILSGEISNPKVDILTLTDDYKNTYFNGEYSFIDRNEYLNLKKEIDELKDFDLNVDENINKLEKYKNGELRYKFGNILISRIKTIRLYNFLKTKDLSLKNNLLIALTYNTVLKNDEYKELEKVIDSIVEGGN